MARYVGIADEAKMGVQADKSTESVAYGDEVYFDLISIEWDVDNELEGRSTVGGGVLFHKLIPKVAMITGTVKARVVDGRALELPMGTLTTPGAASDHDITIANALSYYSIQVALSGSEYAKLLGVKFGGFSLTASVGSPLEISMDFKAISFTIISGSVSGTQPTENPYEYYHGCIKWDTAATDIINDMTLNFTRNIEAKRGIECTSSGSRRLITEIIEKIAEISGDLTIAVQDTLVVKDALGAPASAIGDEIAEVDLEVIFTRDANNELVLNFSNCKVSRIGGGVFDEIDEREWSMTYLGIDLDIEVDVT